MRNHEATRLEHAHAATPIIPPSRRWGWYRRDFLRSRPRLRLTPSLGEESLEVRVLPASLAIAPLVASAPSPPLSSPSPTRGVEVDQIADGYRLELVATPALLASGWAVPPDTPSWWKLDNQGNHVIWYGEAADQNNHGPGRGLPHPSDWIPANPNVIPSLEIGGQFVWKGQFDRWDGSDRYVMRLTKPPDAMTLTVSSPLNLAEYHLGIHVTMRTWDDRMVMDHWIRGSDLAASTFELAQNFLNVLDNTPSGEGNWLQLQIAIEPPPTTAEDGFPPTGEVNPIPLPLLAPVGYEMSLRTGSPGSSLSNGSGPSQPTTGSESSDGGSSPSFKDEASEQPVSSPLDPSQSGRTPDQGEDPLLSLNGSGFGNGTPAVSTKTVASQSHRGDFTGRRRIAGTSARVAATGGLIEETDSALISFQEGGSEDPLGWPGSFDSHSIETDFSTTTAGDGWPTCWAGGVDVPTTAHDPVPHPGSDSTPEVELAAISLTDHWNPPIVGEWATMIENANRATRAAAFALDELAWVTAWTFLGASNADDGQSERERLDQVTKAMYDYAMPGLGVAAVVSTLLWMPNAISTYWERRHRQRRLQQRRLGQRRNTARFPVPPLPPEFRPDAPRPHHD